MGTVGVPWGLSVSVAAESQSRQSGWGKPTSGLCTPIPYPFLRMSSPGTGEARAAAPGNPPLRVLLPSLICSVMVEEELRAGRDQERNFGQSWFSLRWQMSKPSLGWSLNNSASLSGIPGVLEGVFVTIGDQNTVYLSAVNSIYNSGMFRYRSDGAMLHPPHGPWGHPPKPLLSPTAVLRLTGLRLLASPGYTFILHLVCTEPE